MEEIKFKKNDFKIVSITIIGVFFGFLFLNMFVNPQKYVSFIFKYELYIKIFGLIGFIFMLSSVALIIFKYFKSSFGLLIDINGVTDNSSFASVGLIKWKDIKQIRNNSFMSTQFLLIDVYDNDKYINLTKNKFIKIILKTNLKMYGTPVIISNKSLKCNFEELQRTIEKYYQLSLSNKW